MDWRRYSSIELCRLRQRWPGLACATIATAVPAMAGVGTAREDRVQARLHAIADNPTALLRFLTELPKGGDLHQHLAGTVYAESLLQWTAASVLTDTTTQAQIIGAWSMRQFVPSLSESGHNHFFATLEKFGAALGTVSRTGDALAGVLNYAGRHPGRLCPGPGHPAGRGR